ncbi:MAG: sulfatase [Mailhella sp.]|nr:sulfatase [Mailhella sp.]
MREIKNAIVVMCDTMQFNYLGCYGNSWIKTPNIDRFAAEGTLFENCYTEGLPTVPCRRAMLTGRYTLPVKGWSQLDIDDTTIADLCWGQPIESYLIYDAGPWRLPKFGYARGFDRVFFLHGHETDHQYYAQDDLNPLFHAEDYVEQHVIDKADEVLGENVVRPLLNQIECHLKERQYWKSDEDQHAAHIFKEAAKYLAGVDKTKSFFMWIDCFDPHEPWDAPSVYDPDKKCMYDPDYQGKDMFLPIQAHVDGMYTDEELHHIRMLYAEKLTNVDKWFGYLTAAIHDLGLESNTMVMLVSDHGSPMGKGEHGHGIMRKCRPWPYEELAHAPMIVRGPGLPRGKRVKSFVQSCDVAPTVLDWLGLGVHPSMQGKTLLPLIRGEVEKVRDYAIAGYFRYSWSIITEDWSFIHWLKDDEKSVADARFGIYGQDLAASTAHLRQLAKANEVEDRDTAFYNKAWEAQQKMASIDGAAQWTCTAAASTEVPERDELYDRKNDPFQLHNIAHEHKDVAMRLLDELNIFMEDLRNS